MRFYSTARQFLTLRRRGLIITIIDLEAVVVPANEVGWTMSLLTDLYINLVIKYPVPTVARVLVSALAFYSFDFYP